MPRRSHVAPTAVRSAGLVALLACSTGPQPLAETSLTTDSAAYVAERLRHTAAGDVYGVTIVARFRNGSERPVYLGRCTPDTPTPLYDVVAADTTDPTRTGYATACEGIGDQWFEVAPGTTRVDTLRLQWPGFVDGTTGRPEGDARGAFRLLYAVHACGAGGACGPSRTSGLSNAFTVRTAP